MLQSLKVKVIYFIITSKAKSTGNQCCYLTFNFIKRWLLQNFWTTQNSACLYYIVNQLRASWSILGSALLLFFFVFLPSRRTTHVIGRYSQKEPSDKTFSSPLFAKFSIYASSGETQCQFILLPEQRRQNNILSRVGI